MEVVEREGKKLIAIPIEEYKELLMIKGKYEELKSQSKCNGNCGGLHIRGVENPKDLGLGWSTTITCLDEVKK